jgi:hypothetical protein
VGGDVPVDSEMLLVTDFINLKIKSAQSFEGIHRSMVCIYAFIGVRYVYKYLCLYCVSKNSAIGFSHTA